MNQIAELPPQHAVKFYILAKDLRILSRCGAAGTDVKVSGQRPSRTRV